VNPRQPAEARSSTAHTSLRSAAKSSATSSRLFESMFEFYGRPTGKDPLAETTETQVAHVISARGEEPTGLCAKRRQSNRHP
jgi:hypothetical protein